MAGKIESTFELTYAVRMSIPAAPAVIWARLTDAAGFPTWNSTVERIDGPIVKGQKLAIRVPIAPGRVFSPRVVEFEPERRMVWRDGQAPFFQGTRTFTLTPLADGTNFEMVEVFRGWMLPLIKGSLPDFRPVFERYATDLRAACTK